MARWAAIIGGKGIGKSSTARLVVSMLGKTACGGVKLQVGGFVQHGFTDELDRKCYDLHRIATPCVVALARPMSAQAPQDKETVCSFSFNDEAFLEARSWMEHDIATCDVVLIDEVSKLEAMGKGHHDAIVQALAARKDLVVVLSIRAGQLFYVVERYGLQDDAVAVLELPSSDDELNQFVADIAEAACCG